MMRSLDLTGPLLAYWTGKALGLEVRMEDGQAQTVYRRINPDHIQYQTYRPHADPKQGYDLILSEKPELSCPRGEQWEVSLWTGQAGSAKFVHATGDDPLQALCRAIVIKTYGATVPDSIDPAHNG